jgi:ATP-binding protein involved in chromosome partitioning
MAEYHKRSEAQIQEILTTIIDPFTGIGLLENKALKALIVEESGVTLSLVKSYPIKLAKNELSEVIIGSLSKQLGIGLDSVSLNLSIDSVITKNSMKHALEAVSGVGNIIAVSSGKGGVGKSTVSANLALALQAQGARVGILDADIYGPSQPSVLGVSGKPQMVENKMKPLENYGLQIMSIGLMVDQSTPMIWRGPMVTQALEQMIQQSAWEELDYLILDLPPGTGDVQLTLAQKIPLAGAVVVTTPQDLALHDVRKAIKMFEKVDVPMLGVIENMSTHICSNCQHEEAIFGTGGGQKMSDEYNLPYLGAIPLDISIRLATDEGKPTVAKVNLDRDQCSEREREIAQRYNDIALRMAGKLAARKKNYSSLFPKIEISNT